MKRVLSGIQPTGVPHLGNYLGALRNWAKLQHQYHSLYSIVDLHAITLPQDPEKLRRAVQEMGMAVIASGIDPRNSILFRQSKVKEHAELGWILFCQTPVSWLTRMHQFKTKSDKNPMLGLLSYPVLQAADILLYQANLVPVGEDQSQHMNLTTDIAKSFNSNYGNVFTIPKGMYGTQQSMRIMSLKDPTKKMSKSDPSELSRIDITDSPETIWNKVKRATTDSVEGITYDQKERPGISNLLDIVYSFESREGTIEELQSHTLNEFGNMKTSEFKKHVADCIIHHLSPIRNRYMELERDGVEIESIFEDGEARARSIAQETLRSVYKSMGLI
jgi:tryptophanyl-tRNA synthetase